MFHFNIEEVDWMVVRGSLEHCMDVQLLLKRIERYPGLFEVDPFPHTDLSGMASASLARFGVSPRHSAYPLRRIFYISQILFWFVLIQNYDFAFLLTLFLCRRDVCLGWACHTCFELCWHFPDNRLINTLFSEGEAAKLFWWIPFRLLLNGWKTRGEFLC